MVVLSVSANGTSLVLGGRSPYAAPYVGDALSVNLSTVSLNLKVRVEMCDFQGAHVASEALIFNNLRAGCRAPSSYNNILNALFVCWL